MSERPKLSSEMLSLKPKEREIVLLPDGQLEDWSIPGECYYVVDTFNPKILNVYADIDSCAAGRVLDIGMRTRLSDGRHSKVLRGKDQFSSILNYFNGQFDFISGRWDRTSDNLIQFNYATAAIDKGGLGLSPEEAVFFTWTGKRCQEHGYGHLQDIHLRGDSGHYTYVEVLFAPAVEK